MKALLTPPSVAAVCHFDVELKPQRRARPPHRCTIPSCDPIAFRDCTILAVRQAVADLSREIAIVEARQARLDAMRAQRLRLIKWLWRIEGADDVPHSRSSNEGA